MDFCPMTVEHIPPWRPGPRAGLLSAMIIRRDALTTSSFSGRSLKQMRGAEQKVLPVIFCKEDQSVLHRTAHTGAKNRGKQAAERKQW